MAIKSNTLDPLDPRREFVLENARADGEKINYDRELFELLGIRSFSTVTATCSSEVTKVLKLSKSLTDEEMAEKLRDILCDSNEGKLVIGQKAEGIVEKMDISSEKLETAKRLIQGRINLDIRKKVTSLLDKLEGIATINSPKA